MKNLTIILFFLLIAFSSQNSVLATTSAKKGVSDTYHEMVKSGIDCGSNTACKQNYLNIVKQLDMTWMFNWSTIKPPYLTDNSITYIPMVFGKGAGPGRTYTNDELAHYASIAQTYPGSYWLIWNEPELAGQGDLPADIAASVYDSLRNTIKNADPGAKLIVGNVAYGTNWLNSFRENYKDTHGGTPPAVEGWSGHLYRDPSNYAKIRWRNELTNTYRNWMVSIGEGSKEFWLTEFGSLTAQSVGLQILRDQIEWLETQSWITRYAWFHAGIWGSAYRMQGHLFYGSVKNMTVDLNPLGIEYATRPTGSEDTIYHDCPNYATNCKHLADACPSGTTYDRLGSCGDGFKCCNPYLTPTVTPTRTPTPTIPNPTPTITITPVPPTPSPTLVPISTYKGWNKIIFNYTIQKNKYPNCLITRNLNNIWNPVTESELYAQLYYLKCN